MNFLPFENISFFYHLPYLGVLLGVMLSGHFIPVPEDVFLIFVGYMAANGIIHFWYVIPFACAGIIIGDSLLYLLGKSGSQFAKRMMERSRKDLHSNLESHMIRHAFTTLFVSRFITGVRLLTPIIAGVMKVPYRVVFPAVTLGSLIYVPIFISLGYILHNKLTILLSTAQSVRHMISLGVIIVLAIFLLIFIVKRIFNNLLQ